MKTVAKRLSAKLLIVVIGKAWQSGHGGHCAFKRRLWGKPQEGYLGHLQIVGDSKAEMVFWPSSHLHIVEQLKVRGLQASTQCLLASYWPRSWKISQDKNIGGKEILGSTVAAFSRAYGIILPVYEVL